MKVGLVSGDKQAGRCLRNGELLQNGNLCGDLASAIAGLIGNAFFKNPSVEHDEIDRGHKQAGSYNER